MNQHVALFIFTLLQVSATYGMRTKHGAPKDFQLQAE
jgi:hypothetical protein